MVVYLYCVIRGQTGYVVDDQEKAVTNEGQMADRLCRSIIFMAGGNAGKTGRLLYFTDEALFLRAVFPGTPVFPRVPVIYRQTVVGSCSFETVSVFIILIRINAWVGDQRKAVRGKIKASRVHVSVEILHGRAAACHEA